MQTAVMAYDVRMVLELRKPPTEALMSELDHRFEVAEHVHGTKTVSVTERVSVSDEADAIAFVRSLVRDAVPETATVVSVGATLV